MACVPHITCPRAVGRSRRASISSTQVRTCSAAPVASPAASWPPTVCCWTNPFETIHLRSCDHRVCPFQCFSRYPVVQTAQAAGRCPRRPKEVGILCEYGLLVEPGHRICGGRKWRRLAGRRDQSSTGSERGQGYRPARASMVKAKGRVGSHQSGGDRGPNVRLILQTRHRTTKLTHGSDPLRFCQWLLRQCTEKGVQVSHPARAISVSRDASDRLNGVRISRDGTETERQSHRLYGPFYSSNAHKQQYHAPVLSSPRAPGPPMSSSLSSQNLQPEYPSPRLPATLSLYATPSTTHLPSRQIRKSATPSSRPTTLVSPQNFSRGSGGNCILLA